jgi:hypothetical protein
MEGGMVARSVNMLRYMKKAPNFMKWRAYFHKSEGQKHAHPMGLDVMRKHRQALSMRACCESSQLKREHTTNTTSDKDSTSGR